MEIATPIGIRLRTVIISQGKRGSIFQCVCLVRGPLFDGFRLYKRVDLMERLSLSESKSLIWGLGAKEGGLLQSHFVSLSRCFLFPWFVLQNVVNFTKRGRSSELYWQMWLVFKI